MFTPFAIEAKNIHFWVNYWFEMYTKCFIGQRKANQKKNMTSLPNSLFKYQDFIADYLQKIPDMYVEISEKHQT